MMKEGLIEQLKSIRHFFLNSTKCLSEEDSNFKPQEKIYSVAQVIGHTADTVDWFFDGAFSEKGFDMNFDNYEEKMKKYTSVKQGLEYFNKAIDSAIKKINELSQEELMIPFPKGQIMAGAPKMVIVGAIADHTAHHRGALTVYARLLGKVPQMPYGEM